MCGRFSLVANPREIKVAMSGLVDHLPPQTSSRYNIAPTQNIIVVQGEKGERILTQARWGLIPSWAKDASIGSKLINARAETITSKPAFRNLFKHRRCLILADGFYEWTTLPGVKNKQPIYFQLADQKLFAFAGLWDRWTEPQTGLEITTSVIITTSANELLAKYHHRMPVILPPENYQPWLDPDQTEYTLVDLLRQYPAVRMTARPVSLAVIHH